MVLVISSGPSFYVQFAVYCVVLVIRSGPPFYVQCTVYCVVLVISSGPPFIYVVNLMVPFNNMFPLLNMNDIRDYQIKTFR